MRSDGSTKRRTKAESYPSYSNPSKTKRYHEIEYEKEKYREEARLAKNHVELTETALKNAEEKLKEYQKNIKKLENDLHTYELLKHRSQAAVVGLQKVARESQDNVIHLETRLR
ncbi:unnamed protein product [Schistosoma mattheei]|uniref:Uncharacterized protein n=1 Tax=Schistosoma mattheei TaxID=31246 RepID=A0A183PCW8_9TREM|nr:unnamed protein product [Schistosoma mattheei]